MGHAVIARCDASASGAEAGRWSVILPSGAVLVLCQHHIRQHRAALAEAGAVAARVDKPYGWVE